MLNVQLLRLLALSILVLVAACGDTVDTTVRPTVTSVSTTSTDGGPRQPRSPEDFGVEGDDEDLTALAQACFLGEFGRCDDLFINSPAASMYELYGATCGDRTDQPASTCTMLFDVFSSDTSAKTGLSDPNAASVLVAVRSAAHENYDRFVLEFEDGSVPGFEVRYAEEPVLDSSGQVISVAGEGALTIEIPWAEQEDPTPISYFGPDSLFPSGTANIREGAWFNDLQGQGLTWVLGVDKPTGFEVFTLADPPRLVVDVSHR